MSLDLNLQQDTPSLNPSYLFSTWTRYNKKNKVGFFTISNALEDYLPYINSAALNLYIFYAIHAKNEEGFSFYSNESIAKKLHVTQKTITNWNNTLQDLGLITRKANYNSSSTTYLLPLSDFIIKISSKEENENIKLKKFLENEGYNLSNNIHLHINITNPIKFNYDIFQKTYQSDKFKITRRVLLEKKVKTKGLQTVDTKGKEIGWYKKEDEDTLIWTPKKNIDNTSKNRLKLVSQINSSDLLQRFKEKYPKFSL